MLFSAEICPFRLLSLRSQHIGTFLSGLFLLILPITYNIFTSMQTQTVILAPTIGTLCALMRDQDEIPPSSSSHAADRSPSSISTEHSKDTSTVTTTTTLTPPSSAMTVSIDIIKEVVRCDAFEMAPFEFIADFDHWVEITSRCCLFLLLLLLLLLLFNSITSFADT